MDKKQLTKVVRPGYEHLDRLEADILAARKIEKDRQDSFTSEVKVTFDSTLRPSIPRTKE